MDVPFAFSTFFSVLLFECHCRSAAESGMAWPNMSSFRACPVYLFREASVVNTPPMPCTAFGNAMKLPLMGSCGHPSLDIGHLASMGNLGMPAWGRSQCQVNVIPGSPSFASSSGFLWWTGMLWGAEWRNPSGLSAIYKYTQ